MLCVSRSRSVPPIAQGCSDRSSNSTSLRCAKTPSVSVSEAKSIWTNSSVCLSIVSIISSRKCHPEPFDFTQDKLREGSLSQKYETLRSQKPLLTKKQKL